LTSLKHDALKAMTKFKSNLERQFSKTFGLKYETTSIPYVVTHRYTPDFEVSKIAFIETKGMFTGQDRNKHKYIKKQHPHLKILIVFENSKRKLSTRSKTTYADWCDANGFDHCEKNDITFISDWIAQNSHK